MRGKVGGEKVFPRLITDDDVKIILNENRKTTMQQLKSALAVTSVKNLLSQTTTMSDGNDELERQMQLIILRGMCQTPAETFGSIANLWLEGRLDTNFINELKAQLKGDDSLFDNLSPIEQIIGIFKKVKSGNLAEGDMGFLVDHYIEMSRKCTPEQVAYVKGMECYELIDFAHFVFSSLFPAHNHDYVDTQIALLLQVGGVDALSARMVDMNPHHNASWKDF